MLGIPEYKASWERKLKFYESIGYTLGETLFTTQDHENGAIMTAEINEVIKKIKEMFEWNLQDRMPCGWQGVRLQQVYPMAQTDEYTFLPENQGELLCLRYGHRAEPQIEEHIVLARFRK